MIVLYFSLSSLPIKRWELVLPVVLLSISRIVPKPKSNGLYLRRKVWLFETNIALKRIFLCLFAGPSLQPLPKGLDVNSVENKNQAKFENKRYLIWENCMFNNVNFNWINQYFKRGKFRGQSLKKSRQWVLDKKNRQRRQGK